MLPHLALFRTFQTFSFSCFPLLDLCRLGVHLAVVEDGWHCSRKPPCCTTTLNAFGLWGFCFLLIKNDWQELSTFTILHPSIENEMSCEMLKDDIFSSAFWSWTFYRSSVDQGPFCTGELWEVTCCGHTSWQMASQNCSRTGVYRSTFTEKMLHKRNAKHFQNFRPTFRRQESHSSDPAQWYS